MKDKSKNINRAVFVLVFGISFFAGLLKTFTYASYLEIEEFGLFSLISSICTIALYFTSFGMLEGLGREIPILLGTREQIKAKLLAEDALTFGLYTATVIGALIALISLVLMSFAVALLFLYLIIATTTFNIFACAVAASSESLKYAGALMVKNASAVTLGFLGIRYFGVHAVLMAEILSSLLGLAFLGGIKPIFLRNHISSLRRIRQLFESLLPVIKCGLPLVVNSVIVAFSLQVDKWFIYHELGAEQLGGYSFVFQVWNIGIAAATLSTVYIQPRLLRRFTETDGYPLSAYVAKLTFISFTALIVLYYPSFIVFERICVFWFPQYASFKEIYGLAYFSTAFWISNWFSVLIIAHNLAKKMIVFNIANLIFVLILFIFISAYSISLFDIAFVFLLARSVYFLSSFFFVRYLLR